MNYGIHLNIPFPDYLKWPIMSQSALKEGRKSMSHLHATMLKERVKVPTDDMILGSALHTCYLEPGQSSHVIIWDNGARRGKEWEAFKEEYAGYTILTATQGEQLNGMVESLRRHPEVKRWLGRIESVEASIIGDVHGLRMKGRCDALTADPLIDLKKVADGDAYKFTRAAIQWGYHIQAAIYCHLFQRERFMLLAVEDEPPFDVCPYEVSPGMMRAGMREAKQLIEQVHECELTGVWPGRSDVPVMLELPEWAQQETEIVYAE